jgi:hypothetical protein
MSRTRLVFVNPYYANRSDISSPVFFHNAAFQLKAYLETVPAVRRSYEIAIPDLSSLPPFRRGLTDEDDLNLLDAVLRPRPRIAAFSLYCWNVAGLHELAQALRQLAPEVLRIAGGPEVYDRPDFVRQFPAFDVLVEGDGELPLRAVLERAKGVLSSQRAPSLTDSIGRMALYRSSSTRAASSTRSSETAEKPRTVASVPGSPTMRLPLGSWSEMALSPSPFGRAPVRRANSSALRTNSALWRELGLTTRVRLPGEWYA